MSLSFGGLRALTELDLQVAEREIVSVIGPNGAGKTTRLQRHHRHLQADRGRHALRRREHRRQAPAHDHPAGHRAHLPEPAPVPEHVGQGERQGGDLRPHQGVAARVDPAAAARAARGARGRRARRAGARLLRRAAEGLPLGPAGLRPLLRQPPAAGDRARDGDPAAAAAARRAGGRDEPQRDPRGDRADRPPARRARPHDPGDRARHARRRGDLRPRRRARPRR